MTTQTQPNQHVSPLYSIRTRLLGFILLILVFIGVSSLLLVSNTRNAFTEVLQADLTSIANAEARSLAQVLQEQVTQLQLLADSGVIRTTVNAVNDTYPTTRDLVEERLAERDAEWVAGDARAQAVQGLVVNSAISTQNLADFQSRASGHAEILITDRHGGLVAATQATDDFDQSDETWWLGAWANGEGAVYISPSLVFDTTTQTQGIRIAIPIEEEGQPIGVLRSHYELDALVAILSQFEVSGSGSEFILNDAQELISASELSEGLFESFVALPSTEQTAGLISLTDAQGAAYVAIAQPIALPGNELISDLGWQVVVVQPVEQALAPITEATRTPTLLAIAVLAITIAVGYFFSRSLTQPLTTLTRAAERLGRERDWDTRVAMNRRDEYGVLGDAFDTLAAEVQDVLGTLERRVAARTADLETSSEIAAAANQVRELQNLITLTVNLIRDRFNFYYVQIYLVDEARQYAVLADGTGYVGRRLVDQGHKLRLGDNSIVTRSINENRSVMVADTTVDPDYVQNVYLIETRTELAVPLRAQNQVLGVIDIQHSEPNTFDDDSRRLFQTLADQLAITFENARLLTSTEQRARQLATVAEVSIEATTNRDLGELMRSVSKLTRDNFGLYHAHIYLLDVLGEDLVLGGGAGEAGLLMMERGHAIALNDSSSLVAQAARTGQQVISNDITQEANYKPNDLLPHTRSEMALPMIVNEDLIGVLDVQSDVTNRFGDEDAQVLGILAAQVAVAVQNARAFDALENAQHELERRENYYRSLIENASDVITLLGEDNTIIYQSPSVAATLGYAPAELIGKLALDYVHPDDVEHVGENIAVILSEGQSPVIRFRWLHADGHWVWLESIGTDLRSNPAVNAIIVNSRDVTEAHERELERQTLLNITRALNNAQNTDQLLEAATQYFELQGATTANLYYIEVDDANHPVALKTVAMRGEGLPVGVTYDLADFPNTASIWLENPAEPALFDDVYDDPRVDETAQALYRNMNIGAIAIMALRTGAEWVGMISINWETPHRFSEAEKRLLRSMMQQATASLAAYRSQERTQRRAAELEVVAQVSTNATSILVVDELLKNVVNLTKERFGLYHAHIYLLRADGQTLRLAAGSGSAGEMMVANNHQIMVSRRDSVVARAARTRQPAVANDITTNVAFLPNPLLPDTRSELAIPLLVGDDLIGVFDVQSSQIGRFQDDDIRVQTTLANQIASAVRNAQTFEAVQQSQREIARRADEMEGVARVSAAISAELDIEHLLWSVVNLTKETFDRYHAQIYLLNEDKNALVLAAGAGEIGQQLVANRHSIRIISPGVVARAANARMTVAVRDTMADHDFLPNMLLPDTRSELAVPIMYADELLGVLDIQDTRVDQFGDTEIQVKQTLANQVAIAIKNARTFAEVRKSQEEIDRIFRSSIDMIGSANFDGYFTQLNQAWERTLGFTREELMAEPFISFVHPDDVEATLAEAASTDRSAEGIQFTNRYRTKSNAYRWISWRFTVDTTANLFHFIARDVTDEQLREQEQQILLQLSQGLNAAQTIEAVYDVVDAYAQSEGMAFGLLMDIESDAHGNPQQFTVVASSEVAPVPLGSQFDIDDFAFAQMMLDNANNVFMIEDIAKDSRIDAATKDVFQSLHVGAYIGMPLYLRGEWVGFVAMHWDNPTAFTNQIHRILLDVQRQITPQVQAMRVAEAIRQQSTIVTTSRDYIGIASPQGIVEYVNPAGLDWTGYDGLDKVLGSPIKIWYADNVWQRIEMEILPVVIREGYWRGELELLHRDGSIIPVDQTLFTVTDDAGNIINLATIASDITERKEQEREVRRQSALVDNSTNFIGITSLEGFVEYINDYGVALAGYDSYEELDGQPIALFHPESYADHLAEAAIPQVVQTGAWAGEGELLRKDGTIVPIAQSIFIISDSDGNPQNIATIISDISERRAREENDRILFDAAQKLANAQTAQDVFLAVADYVARRGAQSGNLYYIDNDADGEPEWLIAKGGWLAESDEWPVPVETRFYIPEFPSTRIWLRSSNQPTFFGNIMEDERMDEGTKQVYASLNTHSAVLVPLYYRNRWIGVMNFNWADVMEFTEYDDRILTELMRQATAQIDAIRANEVVAQARRDAEMLAEVNSLLSQAGDEAGILSAVSYYVRQFEPVAIYLHYIQVDELDEPSEITTMAVWQGGAINHKDPTLGHTYDLSMLPSARDWIENPTVPHIINDVTTDPRVDEGLRQQMIQAGLSSMVTLPLRSGGRWQAVISANWTTPQTPTPNEVNTYTSIMRTAASVVASRRAYLATQQANEDANLLYRISSGVNAAQIESEVLEAVLAESIVDDPDILSLALFENRDFDNAAAITIIAEWNRNGQALTGMQFELEQDSLYHALDRTQVNICENVPDADWMNARAKATLASLHVEAFMIVPLVAGHKWLGTFGYSMYKPHRFTERQRRLMRSIGNLVTNAVERINLLQQTTRRAAELETVARLSATTTQLLDVDELLQSVADLTRDSFNLYHCHIYLLNQDEVLILAAGSGEIGRMMKMGRHNIPMNRRHSLVARAARTRTATVSNDVRNEPDFLPNPMLANTRSEMAVPMIVGDELVGVLDVQSELLGRFDEDDVRMKTTLADQIAVAVLNAQAFERERRTVEQLKEVDRLKQEFLANMSHELRTPLNSIIGYSEVLLDGVDGELTEDAEEDVEAIHSSGKHLLNIINEILDLAKIDAGQMELRYQQMNLAELLYEVVRSSQVLLKDRPVEMRLDEITAIPDAYLDRVRMNQVILNLVGNAIKFTEEGEIIVSYRMKDDNHILVEIADSGVGMSEEQLEVIFERFRQVDQSSTRRAGGTGLGLTITKQLVEMHGGEIGVRSQLGVGSTFWITLPTYDHAVKLAAQAEDPNHPFLPAEERVPEAGD